MNRAIAWFARNAVAANLLMGFLIVAGWVAASGLHRELARTAAMAASSWGTSSSRSRPSVRSVKATAG